MMDAKKVKYDALDGWHTVAAFRNGEEVKI